MFSAECSILLANAISIHFIHITQPSTIYIRTYVGVMSIWFDFIHRMHCIIYDKHIRTPTTYLRTRILANSNANVCSHLWSYWIYIWSRWPCDHFHMDIYMIISSISSPNWIKPTNTRTSNELFLLRLFLLMCHLIILMSLGLILMLLNFEFCYRFDACMRKTNQQQCKGSTECEMCMCERQCMRTDNNRLQCCWKKGVQFRNEISFLPIYTCRCFERIV